KTQFGQATIKVEKAENANGVNFDTTINKREFPSEILEAIEKSVHDTAPGGAMAGYPFINIKATLTGAEYNELEASEVAYAIAASQAFREACRKAGVRLLEPVMRLEVITPADYTGDVIADINMKRGKILSMGSRQNKEQLVAEV